MTQAAGFVMPLPNRLVKSDALLRTVLPQPDLGAAMRILLAAGPPGKVPPLSRPVFC